MVLEFPTNSLNRWLLLLLMSAAESSENNTLTGWPQWHCVFKVRTVWERQQFCWGFFLSKSAEMRFCNFSLTLCCDLSLTSSLLWPVTGSQFVVTCHRYSVRCDLSLTARCDSSPILISLWSVTDKQFVVTCHRHSARCDLSPTLC